MSGPLAGRWTIPEFKGNLIRTAPANMVLEIPLDLDQQRPARQ
jgi:hypothetical protein